MRIGKPDLVKRNGQLTYQVQVDCSAEQQILWYSLPAEYAGFVSGRSDAPLVALLIPAMSQGENIHLAGTISERLYYSLSHQYQRVLKSAMPSLKLVDVCPADVKPANCNASGVATGFSAGVDSFSVLSDHYYANDVPPGFRLTYLLYSVRGGLELVFRKRAKFIKVLANRISLPVIVVASNVETFYETWDFQQTHTPRRTSVALLLQNGIRRFMYASTYSYADSFVGETYDMAYSDPVALPLLSNRAVTTFSAGSEYTRVEKTLQIADVEDTHEFLTVCVNDHETPGYNCSTCWKCLRTLLTLEVAGLISRYEGVFDLDAYRSVRERYIAQVLQSEDPLLQEVVSFANEANFDYPLYSRMLARFLSLRSSARHVAKMPMRAKREVESIFDHM